MSRRRNVKAPTKAVDLKNFKELLEKGEYPCKYELPFRYSPYRTQIVAWDEDRITVSISVYAPSKGIKSININATKLPLLINDLIEIKKRLEKLGFYLQYPEEL